MSRTWIVSYLVVFTVSVLLTLSLGLAARQSPQESEPSLQPWNTVATFSILGLLGWYALYRALGFPLRTAAIAIGGTIAC